MDVDLYLLRVWKQLRGGCGFRAAVRPLDHQTPEIFSDPAQLAAYLKQRSVGSTDASDAAADGPVAGR